jgi:hypothetical protein
LWCVFGVGVCWVALLVGGEEVVEWSGVEWSGGGGGGGRKIGLLWWNVGKMIAYIPWFVLLLDLAVAKQEMELWGWSFARYTFFRFPFLVVGVVGEYPDLPIDTYTARIPSHLSSIVPSPWGMTVSFPFPFLFPVLF